MRVFIGISPRDEEKNEILIIQQNYRKILKDQKSLRWITKENLHITLIPPWEEKNINKILTKLSSLKPNLKPFSSVLTKARYAPDYNPRLIWLEGSTPPGIIILQDILLKELSKPIENRRFQLHTTVARFNSKHISSFPLKKIEDKIHIELKINSFSIFQSILSQKEADYKIIRSFSLIK